MSGANPPVGEGPIRGTAMNLLRSVSGPGMARGSLTPQDFGALNTMPARAPASPAAPGALQGAPVQTSGPAPTSVLEQFLNPNTSYKGR